MNTERGRPWWVAGLAAAVAAVYLVIGLEVVHVEGVAEREPGPAVPLVIAGIAFAVLAAAVAVRPGRVIGVVGATLTLLVLVGYLVVAPSREPSYEAWGLGLKALQVLLLLGLVLVAGSRGDRTARAAGGTS